MRNCKHMQESLDLSSKFPYLYCKLFNDIDIVNIALKCVLNVPNFVKTWRQV